MRVDGCSLPGRGRAGAGIVSFSDRGGRPASTERPATAALWPGASFEWAFSILCEQVSAICICSSHKGLTGQ